MRRKSAYVASADIVVETMKTAMPPPVSGIANARFLPSLFSRPWGDASEATICDPVEPAIWILWTQHLLRRLPEYLMYAWSILEIVVSKIQQDLISLTADIVFAHVSHNKIASVEVANLIQTTYDALAKAGAPTPQPATAQEPAVSIKQSVKNDYIVCLEDGKKMKMLKRYLRTNYNMTPEEYRAKWNLPRDYPFVAPAYAETRRGLAVTSGLGRKNGTTVAKTAPVEAGPKAREKALPRPKGIAAAKAAAQAHLGTDQPVKAAPAKATAKRASKAKAEAQGDKVGNG
jgi:predicted transcriptional regulator